MPFVVSCSGVFLLYCTLEQPFFYCGRVFYIMLQIKEIKSKKKRSFDEEVDGGNTDDVRD